MQKLSPRYLKAALKSGWAGRFATDRKGVAALEFAMILPMLLAFTFLAFDTSAVMTQSKRATRHYYALGDIVSSSAGDLTCNGIDRAAKLVYESYRHSNWARRLRSGEDQFTNDGALDFRFIVSVVEAKDIPDEGVKGEVQWSFMRLPGTLAPGHEFYPGAKFDIPAGLRVPGTKFVRVDGRVYTKPLIGYLSDGEEQMQQVVRYFPLRFVNDVDLIEKTDDPYTAKCQG